MAYVASTPVPWRLDISVVLCTYQTVKTVMDTAPYEFQTNLHITWCDISAFDLCSSCFRRLRELSMSGNKKVGHALV
jgi:hypothetical protein